MASLRTRFEQTMTTQFTENRTGTAPKSRTWRPILGRAHRWVGLTIALFLVLTGLSGAVISWDHELDALLNPHLLEAEYAQQPSSPIEMALAIEQRYPNVQVTYLPLSAERGHSLAFGVTPRFDAMQRRPHDVAFNQVFVDPSDGRELGKREWGAVWPITRENFISFLYKFHYSLHLPAWGGTDQWGVWLLGGVAMLWTFDCFVAFCLTLPARRRHSKVAPQPSTGHGATPERNFWQRWKPSWLVRWNAGWYRLNFDIHRALGLWTWALLFVLAFTGFSMNLHREVFFPVMSLISDVTPSPFDERSPATNHAPIERRLDYADVLALANNEAQARAWKAPMGDAFYAPDFGIYGVRFFYADEDHGVGGVGHPTLYFDSTDGRLLGERIPWQGTTADLFMQAQFPLHSGRILGLAGRILISLMGIVVAALSVTGVLIWVKKARARTQQSERLTAATVEPWKSAMPAD